MTMFSAATQGSQGSFPGRHLIGGATHLFGRWTLHQAGAAAVFLAGGHAANAVAGTGGVVFGAPGGDGDFTCKTAANGQLPPCNWEPIPIIIHNMSAVYRSYAAMLIGGFKPHQTESFPSRNGNHNIV